MCGIAGYYLKAPAADQSRLSEMARRLAHRGPDGSGFHSAGRVGLAHTRLAIIDLAGGAQPLYNEDRSIALVANGEVYNHLELRAELEALGHRFTTHSDCETLLHAYEAWGENFLDRVLGMYAFALHDATRGVLLLGRDRLGIKPLYYTLTPEGLAFASEIKALRPLLGRPEVATAGLARFLQANFTSGSGTLVRGVERLPPGHIGRMGADGVLQLRRYWSPTQTRPGRMDLDEALEAFDALMEEVITIHLRSDVPFGLFLSGGVDSSILAALISRRLDQPLRTWSVGFPMSGVHNELAAAAAVSERFGTRHTALEVSARDMLERLPHAVWAADDLTGDYANLPVSLLAERAGADLKVVFSGEGGDEVFAGYGRYRMPWIRRLLAELRHPGSGGFRTRGVFSRVGRDLFQPELARAMSAWRTPFVQAWGEAPADWTDLMRRQYVDLTTWLPDDLLVKADRMLMAWGVEGRVPFLDHRVVEFGLALPDGLKVDARSGKRFLKLWGERFLPHDLLWSRKKGFTVPVGEWLGGEWLERYARVVPQTAAVRTWFRPEAVRRLIEAQRRSGRMAAPLWALLNFALWHRLFVEGEGGAPPRLQDPLDFLADQAPSCR
jgi:asparagine synthase (glutamine-hydrolysing)